MVSNEVVDDSQSLVSSTTQVPQLSNAPQVRLQTLDLARHIAIAPDDKRYVVATFDDTRLNRGYVTAVYPQQNGYLTLVRLTVCEFSSETRGEAVQRHVAMVQAIQKGELGQYAQHLASHAE